MLRRLGRTHLRADFNPARILHREGALAAQAFLGLLDREMLAVEQLLDAPQERHIVDRVLRLAGTAAEFGEMPLPVANDVRNQTALSGHFLQRIKAILLRDVSHFCCKVQR